MVAVVFLLMQRLSLLGKGVDAIQTGISNLSPAGMRIEHTFASVQPLCANLLVVWW